jgi:dihydrodipicolinate synthase/N-acetylneuraminate lyase
VAATGTKDAWRGVFAVLCTPFHEDGTLDLRSLAREVEYCVESGVGGLVSGVVASEGWTLTEAERRTVTAEVVRQAAAAVPVVAGISAGSAAASVVLLDEAQAAGADAAIAVPAPSQAGIPSDIEGYYQALSDRTSVPVFIQNHEPPQGTRLAADRVARLVNTLPHVDWVKEETSPPGPAISRELELCGPKLRGIMGGLAGRYLFEEHARGACGTMPACEAADAHALIWKDLDAGDQETARRRFEQLLPLLNLESKTLALPKTVLAWRGVFESDYARTSMGSPLDKFDRAELAAVLARIEAIHQTAKYSPALPDLAGTGH